MKKTPSNPTAMIVHRDFSTHPFSAKFVMSFTSLHEKVLHDQGTGTTYRLADHDILSGSKHGLLFIHLSVNLAASPRKSWSILSPLISHRSTVARDGRLGAALLVSDTALGGTAVDSGDVSCTA